MLDKRSLELSADILVGFYQVEKKCKARAGLECSFMGLDHPHHGGRKEIEFGFGHDAFQIHGNWQTWNQLKTSWNLQRVIKVKRSIW